MAETFPTDAETQAVDEALAPFQVEVYEHEDDVDWTAEGFLTDHARQWVTKRALEALAPLIAERERKAVALALRTAANEVPVANDRLIGGKDLRNWFRYRADRIERGEPTPGQARPSADTPAKED